MTSSERQSRNGPILVVVGTRPEAIKLAPVIMALRRRAAREVIVCHSGQHQDLFDDAMRSFGLEADVSTETMVEGQSLAALHGRLFHAFDDVLRWTKPDTLVVQGDTATVAVAAWAAFLGNIEVAHVEAGLRSGNKWHPFPEEVNRRITSVVGDLHFAPTALSAENLRHEGIASDRIFLTGNTIVDALYALRERLGDTPPPLDLDRGKPILLVTVHRRENFGEPLRNVCAAVRRIAKMHPDLQIVVPMHPNPAAGAVVQQLLGGIPSIRLCRALPYSEFVKLLLSAKIALSDSGGIQEEGPAIGLPVLVLREVTERPEGIAAGSVRLLGTETDRVVDAVHELLVDEALYRSMGTPRAVYGDGLASERIADVLIDGELRRAAFESVVSAEAASNA